MNDNQKKRLQRNLSQSASSAKPFWPRVLIGPGVEQQGYINPTLLPIEDTTLGEFHEDYNKSMELYDQKFKNIKDDIDRLHNMIEALESENKNLKKRIQDIEGFDLD